MNPISFPRLIKRAQRAKLDDVEMEERSECESGAISGRCHLLMWTRLLRYSTDGAPTKCHHLLRQERHMDNEKVSLIGLGSQSTLLLYCGLAPAAGSRSSTRSESGSFATAHAQTQSTNQMSVQLWPTIWTHLAHLTLVAVLCGCGLKFVDQKRAACARNLASIALGSIGLAAIRLELGSPLRPKLAPLLAVRCRFCAHHSPLSHSLYLFACRLPPNHHKPPRKPSCCSPTCFNF